MIHKSFKDIIDALELGAAWSVKVARRSDPDTCMVLDCTGTFLWGPIDSKDKTSFENRYVHLTTWLINADNYYVYATDCKWKD